MPEENFMKEESDFTYERYLIQREYRPENDIPDDDLLPHDTRITQGISELDEGDHEDYIAQDDTVMGDATGDTDMGDATGNTDMDEVALEGTSRGQTALDDAPLDGKALDDAPLPDVPDADAIQPGSPVDGSAPDPDAMPGIDLLNGFDGDENS